MVSLSKRNLVALVGITSAALLGGFAGCSSDDSTGGITPENDSGTVGTDGSPGSDGSPGTDGGPGSDSGGPSTIKTGSVTFNQSQIAAVYSTSATAFFYELPAGTDLDCAGYSTISAPAAAETACTIKVCTDPISSDAGTTNDAGADAGPIILPNTGDITLKTALDTTGTTLHANSDGSYTPVTGTMQLWAPNDATGEVKSDGSATSIAAFDDLAIVTPGNVTTPKLGDTDVSAPATTSTTFDRGTALAVTYSGGVANTKLTVRLTTTSSAKKAIINCDFDAANGSQSIAASDLGNLEQAGTTGVTGAYSVQARSITPTTSSGYSFNVVLGANDYLGSFTNSN